MGPGGALWPRGLGRQHNMIVPVSSMALGRQVIYTSRRRCFDDRAIGRAAKIRDRPERERGILGDMGVVAKPCMGANFVGSSQHHDLVNLSQMETLRKFGNATKAFATW